MTQTQVQKIGKFVAESDLEIATDWERMEEMAWKIWLHQSATFSVMVNFRRSANKQLPDQMNCSRFKRKCSNIWNILKDNFWGHIGYNEKVSN